MTTVDLTLSELCAAVYWMAGFQIWWAAKVARRYTPRARARWLRRQRIR